MPSDTIGMAAIVTSRNGIERPIFADSRMLKLALAFVVISVIAGVLGFTNVAADAAEIAKIPFVVFLFSSASYSWCWG
jgi:uncharacterized membrane protein YtjA (UPF0391 family)